MVFNNVLAVKVMQNHINCARSAIIGTNVDQSFFIGNLIYQNAAGANGVLLHAPASSKLNSIALARAGHARFVQIHLEKLSRLVLQFTFTSCPTGLSSIC